MLSESDRLGGAEIMAVKLAERLLARGHDVVYAGRDAGSDWAADQFRALGIPVEPLTFRSAIDFRELEVLCDLVRRNRIDVIHSHLFTMAVYGTAVSLLEKLPHIITMHGTQRNTTAIRRRVALRWAFKHSHAVAAVSKHTRNHLVDSLGRDFENLKVIPNGVEDLPGDPEPVRAELGLDPQELLIVAVGNMWHRKGHIRMLKALAHVGETVPRWRVAIAGRPEDAAPAIRQFISERGWERKVHLLGARGDIPNLLAAANIFVMPSDWEGLPLAILEAMFARCAILATRAGGIAEAIDDEQTGLLADPSDGPMMAQALQRLMTDEALRNRLSSAARACAVERFGLSTMCDSYERLFQTAISQTTK